MRKKHLHLVSLTTVLMLLLQILSPAAAQAKVNFANDRRLPPGIQRRETKPVELQERRTSHSKTYDNGDGTLTTDVYAKPIHYRDSSGRFQRAENGLVAGPGGSTIHNVGNQYRATFTKGSGPDFLRVEHRGGTLTMDLQGGREKTATWQENRLTYADVLPGVDLRYTVETDHLKEEIILKSAGAPSLFTFRLKAPGTRLEETSNGHRLNSEADGETIFSLPRMYMRDAAGAMSGQVGVEVRESGNILTLTITPDAAWLGEATRAYPVVIDPTIAVQPAVNAGMDTTISSLWGLSDVNLGYDATLEVGKDAQALLKFDLSAIPRGAAIDSASLEMSSLSTVPTSNTTGIQGPTQPPTVSVSLQPGSFYWTTYSVRYTYVTAQGLETKASPAASIMLGTGQALDVDTGLFPAGVVGTKIYVDNRYCVSSSVRATTVFAPECSTPPPTGTFLVPPTAAPTVTAISAPSGTTGFPAGSYNVQYSYFNSVGETPLSPASGAVALTDGKGLQVSVGTLPAGTHGAHVYVSAANTPAARIGTVFTSANAQFGTPPVSTVVPAPAPSPETLPNPTSAPVVAVGGTGRPFAAGSYAFSYAFVSPSGETGRSPAGGITLAVGQYPNVTIDPARVPTGTTGIRVYMLDNDGRWYPVGFLAGAQGGTLPIYSPPGYRNPQPAASTVYTTGPNINVTTTTVPESRLQAGATYHVAAAWIFPGGDSTPAYGGVTIPYGYPQAIRVHAYMAPPTGSLGMRVYMGRESGSLGLIANITGTMITITGEHGLPAAPAANSTNLPAPAAYAVLPTALPAGTYSVAYTTLTGQTESGPSALGTVSISDGQAIDVTVPPFSGAVTGANVYIGQPGQMLFVKSLATNEGSITELPDPNTRTISGEESGAPAPALTARTVATISAGTYSARYTYTDGQVVTAASTAASVSVAAGQAVNVIVPEGAPEMNRADVYFGAPGAERRVLTGFLPGRPVLITGLAPDAAPAAPEAVTGIPAKPVLTQVAGGTLQGDYYVTYSYGKLDNGRLISESARSPEVFQTLTTPGSLQITTAPMPGGWDHTRIYVGKRSGEEVLVRTLTGTAQTVITSFVPAGISVNRVDTPWSEADATWLNATGSTFWFERGGDYAKEAAVTTLASGDRFTANLTGLVRDWTSGRVRNDGILLRSAGSMVTFASSDHPLTMLRPVLRVTYREQPSPLRVTLTSPHQGDEVSHNVTLAASVTTSDTSTRIDRVEFYVNNALVGKRASAPYSVTWYTANLPRVPYTIEARAFDSAGRMASSAWTPVLADAFGDQDDLDLGATTAWVDLHTGTVNLPSSSTANRGIIDPAQVRASSEKPRETYPASNLVDNSTVTYWKSPGRSVPDADEMLRFRTGSTRISTTATVTPRNTSDRLLAKLQAFSSTGAFLGESDWVPLDSVKSLTATTTQIHTDVRLLLSNLKPDITTGLYHAEIAEVVGSSETTAALSDGLAYQGIYAAANAADGQPSTGWVSDGKAAPVDTEWLEFAVREPVNAIYVKPRTPGVRLTLRKSVPGSEPLLVVDRLLEGTYRLSEAVSAGTVLRMEFTDLAGDGAPGTQARYFAGIDELDAFSLTLGSQEALVQSQAVNLGTPTRDFILDAVDSQPSGSTITYRVEDAGTWRLVSPGTPFSLSAPARSVRVQAELRSDSAQAVPILSSWRLSARTATVVNLSVQQDTLAPSVSLAPIDTDVLTGRFTLKVNASDNVGVTRVSLFADGDTEHELAFSETAPFDLTVDLDQEPAKTWLKTGTHYLWVKATDAAGNIASTKPAAAWGPNVLSDTFADTSNIDLDSAVRAAVSTETQLITSAVPPRAESLSISSYLTKNFNSLTPGWFRALLPPATQGGQCSGGYLYLYYQGILAKDVTQPGECNTLRIDHHVTTSFASIQLEGYQNQAIANSVSVEYPGRVEVGADGKTYDYSARGEITSRTIPVSGVISGVSFQASDNRSSGTYIEYLFSADDGRTWSPVSPGQFATVAPGAAYGTRFRLKAHLWGAKSSPSSLLYDVPARIYDWTATVSVVPLKNTVTVSRQPVPSIPTGSRSGTIADLQWNGTQGGYVYRSADSSPGPEAVVGVWSASNGQGTFKDGANLLRNSSFEKAGSGIPNWTPVSEAYTTIDSDTAFVGRKSLKTTPGGGLGVVSQDILTLADGTPLASTNVTGTTFTAHAHVKGEGVAEYEGGYGIRLVLYYQDGTTKVAAVGLPGGTFGWQKRSVSVWADKAVSKVQVQIGFKGGGQAWFDAVELDVNGGLAWNAGELSPDAQYCYRVTTAVSGPPLDESAPSGEWCTGGGGIGDRLGIKGFWPYSAVDLAGGAGYVNLSSGNVAYRATDMVYPGGLLAMTFQRTYNTQGAAAYGPLGYGWDHNYNWVLTKTASGDRTLKEGDGSTFTFVRADGGSYVTPPGSRMKLVVANEGADEIATIVRSDNNLLYRFDAEGRLSQISEPNGHTLTLAYETVQVGGNPFRRLASVTNSYGRAMALSYDLQDPRRIVTVTHSGSTPAVPRRVRFEYDGAGNLERVHNLEDQSTTYTYDPMHVLLTTTDALGAVTQLTYTGPKPTLNQVQYPDSTKQTFTFGAAGDKPLWTKTAVTNALGFAVTYQVDDKGLLKKQSFTYGTVLPGDNQIRSAWVAYDHDAMWNVTAYTDPRGYVYYIAYDARSNVTSVTDRKRQIDPTCGRATSGVYDL